VGTSEFAEFADSKLPNSLRFVHERDLVPHLPPRSFAFQHAGEEIFEFDDRVVECGFRQENDECCNRYLRYSTKDHLLYMNETMGMASGICMWQNGTLIDFDMQNPVFEWSSDFEEEWTQEFVSSFNTKMDQVDTLVDEKKHQAAEFIEETKGKMIEVEQEIMEIFHHNGGDSVVSKFEDAAENFIKTKLTHRSEIVPGEEESYKPVTNFANRARRDLM
jgi:hypothetical protein